MADTNILREYLIKVGFKVDEASSKKADANYDRITKQITKFEKVAAAGAVAFAAGVTKMVNQLDGLYWASKRTGASVGNIKAMGFAASQLGSSADASASSLANFARLLKTNPGSEGIFKQLGIQSRDASGKMRDTVDLMSDLGKKLGEMDYALANQYAQLFGIDETMLDAMRSPEFGRLMDEHRARVKAMGGDMEESAKVAHEYARAMGEIKDTVTVLATAFGSKLLPTLRDASGAFRELTRDWVKILKEWDGTDIGRKLMEGLGLAKTGGGVKLSADAQRRIDAGETAREPSPFVAYPRVGTEKGRGGVMSGGLASSPFASLIARGEGDYNTVNRGKAHGYKAGTEDLASMTVAEVLAAQKEGRFKAAGRYQMIPGTLEAGMKALGMSGAEKFDKATQDRLFEGYLAGSKRPAIMDYLSGKSGDIKAAILAVSQEWASVANPLTGKSFYAGDGVNRASISVEEMTRALEQTRGRYALSTAGGPQVNQTTNITVNGAGDARDTAAAVSGAMTSVNQSLVRNLAPRVM